MKNYERILIYQNKLFLYLLLSHNSKSTIVLYKNKNFPKIVTFVKIIEKMQLIDEKLSKRTHLSTKLFLILISKSQSQIYNSSL